MDDMVIKYGGRAAGAFLAHRFVKLGGGLLGTAGVIAIGWLAGGFVADYFATPSHNAGSSTAAMNEQRGGER